MTYGCPNRRSSTTCAAGQHPDVTQAAVMSGITTTERPEVNHAIPVFGSIGSCLDKEGQLRCHPETVQVTMKCRVSMGACHVGSDHYSLTSPLVSSEDGSDIGERRLCGTTDQPRSSPKHGVRDRDLQQQSPVQTVVSENGMVPLALNHARLEVCVRYDSQVVLPDCPGLY